MNKLPTTPEEQLVDAARRAHGPSPEQLTRTLDSLHARLDFRGEAPRQQRRAVAAAAAAVAADMVVASTSKAASALTGKVALKLIVATMALGGGVTTAAMLAREPAPKVAPRVEVAAPQRTMPHATQQPAPIVEPAPVVAPVLEPTPEVSPTPTPTPPESRSVARAAQRRPAEMTLIGRALASLRDGNPQRALSLLDEHAERYPRGKFATERQGLRVLALCAAGRRDEGQRARAAFMRELASAPIAARVRDACGEIDKP